MGLLGGRETQIFALHNLAYFSFWTHRKFITKMLTGRNIYKAGSRNSLLSVSKHLEPTHSSNHNGSGQGEDPGLGVSVEVRWVEYLVAYAFNSGYCWVDVRDVARAHVEAMESPTAANKRFLVAAGSYNNRIIVDLIRQNFPEYHSALPLESAEGGNYPDGGTFKIDSTRSKEMLGINYRSLESSVVDTVNSFKTA